MEKYVFVFRFKNQFIGESYWRGDIYQNQGFFVIRTNDIFESKMFTSIPNALTWERQNLHELPDDLEILKLKISLSIIEVVKEKRAKIKKGE